MGQKSLYYGNTAVHAVWDDTTFEGFVSGTRDRGMIKKVGPQAWRTSVVAGKYFKLGGGTVYKTREEAYRENIPSREIPGATAEERKKWLEGNDFI